MARSTDAATCCGTFDLFIVGAVQYSDEDVTRFDDVIIRLAVDIEISARALLAIRLAPIPNAPTGIIRSLAADDIIDIAGPVLTQSERLDDTTLAETPSKKGQEHLLAILRRRCLCEAVTDVLVERGDQQVVLSTAENRGAKFSETGFATLVSGRTAMTDSPNASMHSFTSASGRSAPRSRNSVQKPGAL